MPEILEQGDIDANPVVGQSRNSLRDYRQFKRTTHGMAEKESPRQGSRYLQG
jgi:hypothetical protein